MNTHREETARRLIHMGIIAVVRAPSAEVVRPLARALVEGGVLAIEITLTTPDACRAIRQARAELPGEALVGVGTVLNPEAANRAIEAGAQFVVSPILRAEIARTSQAAGIPVMLGAYTPTEAQLVHESGADFVKLFPADSLGPAYIRALRAPLPHLRVVPTGGVDLHNIADFVRAGCAALGVGSSLVAGDLIQSGNWAGLTQRARAFTEALQAARVSQ